MDEERCRRFYEAKQQGPNPFRKNLVIADEEVWGRIISDLDDINKKVSDTIIGSVRKIHDGEYHRIGITLTGERGSGKSHILRRIWQFVDQNRLAFFSYIPACPYPERIDHHVRFYLVTSLNKPDLNNVTQWQKLLAHLFSTLKGSAYEEEYNPYIALSSHPDKLIRLILERVPRNHIHVFFEKFTEDLLGTLPNLDLDFTFVKHAALAAMRNLSDGAKALAWLRGSDDEQGKDSSRSAGSPQIPTIRQICKMTQVLSLPVILCFDQVESGMADSSTGDSATQVVAKCIDRIYFECVNYLSIFCLPSGSLRDALMGRGGIEQRVAAIKLQCEAATSEQMLRIVQNRMDWFFKEKGLNSSDYRAEDNTTFPVRKKRIEAVASAKAGIRDLLNFCAEDFDAFDPGYELCQKITTKLPQLSATLHTVTTIDTFVNLHQELQRSISIDQSEEKLVSILTCAMGMLPHTQDLCVTAIQKINANPRHDLHFIIEGQGTQGSGRVHIGVRVCEATNHNTIQAVLKRLLRPNPQITRNCLIRSEVISDKFHRCKELEQQLMASGGEVIILQKHKGGENSTEPLGNSSNCGELIDDESIKSLAALERIYSQHEDYNFSQAAIMKFVQELKIVSHNPLIQEILSPPPDSGVAG